MNTDGPVPDGSEDAWWSFRTLLTRRVQTLEPGAVVSLVVKDSARKGDGSGGYLQVLATDASWLRDEVSSNEFLAPEHQVDASGESLLEELGWMPPEPRRSRWKGSPAPNFYLDVERAMPPTSRPWRCAPCVRSSASQSRGLSRPRVSGTPEVSRCQLLIDLHRDKRGLISARLGA